MKIKLLVIIPARCGSKGVLNKNIKLLGGKSLLLWTADAVYRSRIDNCLTILSTDSLEYSAVGLNAGLIVPFLRPDECASDTASAFQVAEHALQWFYNEYGYFPEQLMWLQPTSPFRSSAVITQALDMMKHYQADGVIGCKEIYRNLTTLFDCEDGFLRPLSIDGQKTQSSRQEIKPLLTPNGAMYLCKTSVFLEKKSFYGERTLPLIMDSIQSLDIDSLTDWAMAEAFIQAGLVEMEKIDG